MVLIMTVNPGFGGQKFIPYTLDKVRDLKRMIDKKGLKTDIEVDGGINLEKCRACHGCGARISSLRAARYFTVTSVRMSAVFWKKCGKCKNEDINCDRRKHSG